MTRTVFRDPVSGFSHLFGALMAVWGTAWLAYLAATQATAWHLASLLVFGASMILLYAASATYHLVSGSERLIAVLRRIDHSMIYILIAGTYTPICLVALRGPWGWSLLGVIWGLTLLGIVLKILWFDAPRWLYTLFYVIMGWLVVIAFVPLLQVVSLAGVLWLLAGGLLYSTGAIIYATQWPRIAARFFGFHEIFHFFILGGTACHFWFMYRYILPLGLM